MMIESSFRRNFHIHFVSSFALKLPGHMTNISKMLQLQIFIFKQKIKTASYLAVCLFVHSDIQIIPKRSDQNSSNSMPIFKFTDPIFIKISGSGECQ